MKHTAETLAKEFFSRSKDGINVRLTAKQVAWLQSLLHAMDRNMPYTHTYSIPTNDTPLTLVIYPNGGGFIKVSDFATEVVNGKWRVKPQYA